MAEKKYTRIVVEENNEHGFDSYRVPGIVTASNGDLLLTYEGRKDGGNSRTLFLRRYRMIGETIEPIGDRVTMVSPKDDELIHNPLLIAAAEGKLYFFWCQDYKRLFLKESDDNGVSFGTERELTSLIDGFRKEWPIATFKIYRVNFSLEFSLSTRHLFFFGSCLFQLFEDLVRTHAACQQLLQYTLGFSLLCFFSCFLICFGFLGFELDHFFLGGLQFGFLSFQVGLLFFDILLDFLYLCGKSLDDRLLLCNLGRDIRFGVVLASFGSGHNM